MGQVSVQDNQTMVAKSTTTRRRAYVAPNLLKYGSVAKLTQTGSGSRTDVCATMNMMNSDPTCFNSSVGLPAPRKRR